MCVWLICVPVAAINISEQNYLRYHKSQLYSIYQHQQNESAHSNRFKMLHNKVQFFKSFHSFFLFHFVPEIAKKKKNNYNKLKKVHTYIQYLYLFPVAVRLLQFLAKCFLLSINVSCGLHIYLYIYICICIFIYIHMYMYLYI